MQKKKKNTNTKASNCQYAHKELVLKSLECCRIIKHTVLRVAFSSFSSSSCKQNAHKQRHQAINNLFICFSLFVNKSMVLLYALFGASIPVMHSVSVQTQTVCNIGCHKHVQVFGDETTKKSLATA